MKHRPPAPPARRGFAILLVLWVVGLAGVVIAAVQTTAFTEAVAGREALARVRAYWAARAGVEAAIARLGYATENPDLADAYSILDDLAESAEGEFDQSLFRVSFTEEGKEVMGPADAHAKLNINRMSRESLMTLPYMTEDVADAILDWIDEDDDTNPLGAEIAYYQSLPSPYEPRNAPMRSIQELELVAGVYNAYVRGEDWNLNGRLDPNENDGDVTFPPDNEDDRLDAGWSGLLTTLSVDDELTPSGEARLDLRTASAGDIQKRTSVDSTQAQAIADYVAASQNARMRDFIRSNLRDLAAIAQQGGGGSGPVVIQDGQQPRVPNLTNDQLAALIDECAIDPETPTGPMPGKLNLNTCTAEMLEYLPGISPATADAVILERSGRPQGFGSIIDLVEVPTLSRRQVAQIYDVLTVRSNTYVVTSRGRDAASGLQVELVATIDRSSLPVVISEISVR